MSVLRDGVNDPPPPPAPSPAASAAVTEPAAWRPKRTGGARGEWNLAFFGLLLYLCVDYLRLNVNYEILRPFQLGKVAAIMGCLGILMTPALLNAPSSALRRVSDFATLAFIFGTALSCLTAHTTSRALDTLIGAVIWGILYLQLSRAISTTWSLRMFMAFWLLANFKIAQHVVRAFGAAMGESGAYGGAQMMGSGFGAGTSSFFGNSADLGVGMCVAWPIASYLVLAKITKWKRWMVGLASIFYLAAIIVCGSRGAIVGAAGMLLIALIRSSKRLPALLMVMVMVPAVYFFLPTGTKIRFQSAMTPQQDKTAAHRLRLWAAGRQMFVDHPLLGVGPFCFGTAYLDNYGGKEDPENNPYVGPIAWVPHSTYIELSSQWGLAGILPMLLIGAQIFRTNAATRKRLREALGKKEASQTFEFCLATGLDVGFVGYLVSGAFVAVLMYPHIWMLLGLSTGMYTSLLRPGTLEQLRGEVVVKKTSRFSPALAR